jgi:hypothetical protein
MVGRVVMLMVKLVSDWVSFVCLFVCLRVELITDQLIPYRRHSYSYSYSY